MAALCGLWLLVIVSIRVGCDPWEWGDVGEAV